MAPQFFEFEADFVATLRCIPMGVRFKLDLCGIKLSLRAWSVFDAATRACLVSLPVDTAGELVTYRGFLSQAIEGVGEPVVAVAIEPEPAWMDEDRIPDALVHKALELDVDPGGLTRWRQLGTLQRFALTKLTRGGHENDNLLPALREFGLAGRKA